MRPLTNKERRALGKPALTLAEMALEKATWGPNLELLDLELNPELVAGWTDVVINPHKHRR